MTVVNSGEEIPLFCSLNWEWTCYSVYIFLTSHFFTPDCPIISFETTQGLDFWYVIY